MMHDVPAQTATNNAPRSRGKRVRVGLGIGLTVVGGVFFGGWLWTFLYYAIICFAFYELRAMFAQKGVRVSALAFYPTCLAICIAAHLDRMQWMWPILLLAISLVSFQWLFSRPRQTLSDLIATMFSLIYLGLFPTFNLLIRELGLNRGLPWWEQNGLQYLLLVVLVVIASDVGAYYAGKRFGRHLLYPELSPKKTHEGAFGGLLAGILVGLLGAILIGFPLYDGIVLSTIIIIAAALGDLVESKIKREIGVKDSSALLAGHGGMLDRIDSYIFSFPLAYYYIHWVIHHEGIWRDVVRMTQDLL